MIDITELASRIYNLPGFQRLYRPLLIKSIQSQFQTVEETASELELNYLLNCASIFGDSNDSNHLDAAYRIAQFAIQNGDEDSGIKGLTILDKMTNHPSIELAIKTGLVDRDYTDNLPLYSKLDTLRRNIKYSFWDAIDEKLVSINKFQYDVLEKKFENQLLSISAPTSAGKSFILLNLLKEFLAENNEVNVVYIVPTRALISQVEDDIRRIIRSPEFYDVFITSMPIVDELLEGYKKRVFVLTQERLHWLNSEVARFKVDYLIVDEAQKINDGSRGVILQNVIDDLIMGNPKIQVIFSSPMTSNPEVFLQEIYDITKMESVQKEFVPVNQNLIWVNSIKYKPKEWELKLCYKEQTYDIGKVFLESKPNNVIERLSYIVKELGDSNGGNLIYTKIPTDAEKVAHKLADLLSDNTNLDNDIANLINLIKEVISSKYSLIDLLKKGVAYHYGNMPLIIKAEIERLFKLGKIKYLVCTSTLIEGVNLPAKSIFIRTPKKGQTLPLTEVEFWNLAGRAGRQGLEFQGNIICVDTNDNTVWENPPTKRKKYSIEFYTRKLLNENINELIEYTSIDAFEEGKYNLDYEHTVSYLLKIYNSYSSLKVPSVKNIVKTEDITLLERNLEQLLEKIDIPDEVLYKNSGISVFAQQKLKNFFQKKIDTIHLYEPVIPNSKNAVDRYEKIINILQQVVPIDHEDRTRYLAFLVTDWMSGKPLNYLISKSQQYWDRNGGKNHQTVVRNTLKDVEEFARFKFIKYVTCYKDILNLVKVENGLQLNDDEDLLKIWLEIGASNKTVVSLMGIGLNRSTALEVAKQTESEELNRSEVIDFLLKIDSSKLNKIMAREVDRIIGFYYIEEESN